MPREPWLEQKYAMNRARLEALGYIDKDGNWLIDPLGQTITNTIDLSHKTASWYEEANTGACCAKHG